MSDTEKDEDDSIKEALDDPLTLIKAIMTAISSPNMWSDSEDNEATYL